MSRFVQWLLWLWWLRPTARGKWLRAYDDAVRRRDWQTCDYLLAHERRREASS